MDEVNEIFRQFHQGHGEWKKFINSIKITNIHGWSGQTMEFHYPVVAVVGENGIGKSTFLKAAVCAYKNTAGKDFYPSKMFMNTQWDREALNGALIEYHIREGNVERDLKWKRTKEWGFTPKKKKPERYVSFWDISRTLPIDATAGYAKVALSNSEVGSDTVLEEESIRGLSFILGQHYTNARFTKTNVDQSREVGLLTKSYGEISQFHQGAGEDSILDLIKALQTIPQQSLLVIDEVENSLHPQAQRRFVQYLLTLSRKKKIQIILSTHSPFVLEELPPIARILLVPLSDQKQIIDSVSTNFALSTIDDHISHPDLYIHVEDEEAEALVWEILKTHQDRYDEFSKRITILDVGSCSVVDTLNDYSQHNKLPYKSVSIVDGDKKTEYPDCLSLPGNRAPEKMVFEDLKNLEWNNLTERFGMGAGALYKILDDAMLEPDHHFWTEYVVNVKPFALDERNAADFHQRRGL